MSTAVVVGSGPNGLAAAVHLAQAGLSVTVLEAADTVGGGTRTSELTIPGLLHDHCSAVHIMGAESPAFTSMELDRHGLKFAWPEIDLAHPLDGGRAGHLVRSVEDSAAAMGSDGDAWRKLFGPVSASFPKLCEDVLRPVAHLPAHPLLLARFGARAALPPTVLARRWKSEETRALFGGVAAHAFRPLNSVMGSAIGLSLVAAGHAYGWPVALGGSRAISDAMAARLLELGGTIETGNRVSQLPSADVVLLDVTPRAVIEIAADRLPSRVKRAYQRYKHGPAAFKIDLAVEGGIPWTNDACRRAGTVHVAGTFEEIAAAEAAVAAGRMPERPYVLLSQQYLADPSRSNGDTHPIWAYAHVPHGYRGDATDAILNQIERFAPGFRERIVATHTTSPGQWPEYNANYIGGDIITGANTAFQIVQRPRLAIDPYSTGIPGVFICSAATPPGGGVHGMCGLNAANSALKHLKH